MYLILIRCFLRPSKNLCLNSLEIEKMNAPKIIKKVSIMPKGYLMSSPITPKRMNIMIAINFMIMKLSKELDQISGMNISSKNVGSLIKIGRPKGCSFISLSPRRIGPRGIFVVFPFGGGLRGDFGLDNFGLGLSVLVSISGLFFSGKGETFSSPESASHSRS